MLIDRFIVTTRGDSQRRALTLPATVLLATAVFAATLTPCLAHTRHHHSRFSAHRHVYLHMADASVSRDQYAPRDLRTLMSRGAGFDAPANAPITGEVALVTTDNASIVAGREQGGQLLAHVDKGTAIVVTGQTDTYYAVAMSNHTIGFITKTDAELQNLQVTASGASSSTPGSDPSAQGQPSGAPVVTIDNMCPLAKGILQSATNCLGVVPYVYGGTTAAGIDCSAFVQAVFGANGIKLPRTAAQQANVGYEVPLRDITQWMPGDRMYFQCHHDYVDHTAIYMGNGYFIHATINHHGVSIDKVQADYYWDHLVAVRRSVEIEAQLQAGTTQVGSPDYESSQE